MSFTLKWYDRGNPYVCPTVPLAARIVVRCGLFGVHMEEVFTESQNQKGKNLEISSKELFEDPPPDPAAFPLPHSSRFQSSHLLAKHFT